MHVDALATKRMMDATIHYINRGLVHLSERRVPEGSYMILVPRL